MEVKDPNAESSSSAHWRFGLMDVLEWTDRLVALDSQNPGRSEAEIAREVEAACTELDFEVRRVEIEAGRPNLLVSVDRGSGPHLGLCGHLDTKPIGQALGAWRSDPFRLTIDGDLAYGLGASDMKGAVAAMLVTLARFADDGPRGVLTAVLTADEEQGSNAGAKALVASGLLPEFDAIVIGEPSGIDSPWESLHLVSRGISCFDVEVRTQQGHSGLSDRLGKNAVLVAADLVEALGHFRPTVSQPGSVACTPTVNPGMHIQGGVAFGTWPGWCTVGTEIRLVPGMDRDEVQREVEDFVNETVGRVARATVHWREGSMGWMPAVGLDPNAPIVRAAQRACTRVLGHELPITAYPGGTDATYFIGQAGIPTIASLGPGWLSVAHGANECVGVGQLETAVELYTTLARDFMSTPT
jgi:acetylornithine deacetylase/succinyl-diaminopimelate desuccinylase-like protein